MSVCWATLQTSLKTRESKLRITQTWASPLTQMSPANKASPIYEAGQLAWWRERARREMMGIRSCGGAAPLGLSAGSCGYLHIEMGGQVSNFTRNGWHHLA